MQKSLETTTGDDRHRKTMAVPKKKLMPQAQLNVELLEDRNLMSAAQTLTMPEALTFLDREKSEMLAVAVRVDAIQHQVDQWSISLLGDHAVEATVRTELADAQAMLQGAVTAHQDITAAIQSLMETISSLATGQQSLALFFQPARGALVLAIGTMAVTAHIGPGMAMSAVFTVPHRPAQFVGAAGGQMTEDFERVSRQSVSLEKVRQERAQDFTDAQVGPRLGGRGIHERVKGEERSSRPRGL